MTVPVHLYLHFRNKGFSVQLRKMNPFGRIAVDQTTEETVNKDMQTAGETGWFTLKPGTMSGCYLAAEHRAAALRQLREQISVQSPSLRHSDLDRQCIRKDESDIRSLVETLENWTNPLSEDSDLCLHIHWSSDTHPPSRIIIRRGTKAHLRLVDITKLAEALGSEACTALLTLHARTGCDSLSALDGHGKLRALKVLLRDDTFRKAFEDIGTGWHLSPEVFKIIQSFTCQLYYSNTTVNKVNELRYQIFRGRGGDVESGQLPPCKDALFQHTLHVNYQLAVWRRSLENSPDLPDPSAGHSWEINETGNLAIKWMTGLPAPEVVLDLMSCRCSHTCRPHECTCIVNGLKCPSACKMSPCSNMDDNDEEIHQDAEDLSDEDD